MEALQRWRNSPEYQAALKGRREIRKIQHHGRERRAAVIRGINEDDTARAIADQIDV